MLMRILFACVFSLFLILAFSVQSFAQQTQAAPTTSTSPVPRLIKFSGTLLDRQGQPLKGPVGVTFSLYAQQSGDSPLWMETQNVEVDAKGVYAVLLGANTAAGLPEEMFRSGEARWLGIQPEHEPELPRVLLVSAPYALKAADAETLGGLPASAFVLAGSPAIVTNGSAARIL
jgi:trimeric autotransporter adhesin